MRGISPKLFSIIGVVILSIVLGFFLWVNNPFDNKLNSQELKQVEEDAPEVELTDNPEETILLLSQDIPEYQFRGETISVGQYTFILTNDATYAVQNQEGVSFSEALEKLNSQSKVTLIKAKVNDNKVITLVFNE